MLSSVRKAVSNLAFSPVMGSGMLHFAPTQSFGSQKFAKFDFTDALNVKTLLTEEELMVSFFIE